MMKIIGSLLLLFGFVAVAGSAGDCDGKCMEYANTLGEMLITAGIGLTMCVVGGIIILSESNK